MKSQHLVQEKPKASGESDEEKGTDPGEGHGSPCPVEGTTSQNLKEEDRSPYLVEDMKSQHLVQEEPTASGESDEDRGTDPGGGDRCHIRLRT